MKQIDSGYRIITESNPSKKIEMAARICYKSEDKITNDSALKMINNLIKNQHTAMLEHADMAFIVNQECYMYFYSLKMIMENELYSDEDTTKQCYLRFTVHHNRYVISGNIRAWLDFFDYFFTVGNKNEDAMPFSMYIAFVTAFPFLADKYEAIESKAHTAILIKNYSFLSACERMVHETLTVVFTSDLLIQRELVRHRPASFAGESTRYCNYSKDKFGNEISVITPKWVDKTSQDYFVWECALADSEKAYMRLINDNVRPELARDVLPATTKCDTVVTANLKEWKHILELRACDKTGPAHPKMHEIMFPLLGELKSKYSFAFSDLSIERM